MPKNAGEKGKITALSLFVIQLAVIVYTCSGICAKMTANHPSFSFFWLLWVGLEITALCVYALFWQQIIKRFDLSVAYANRAVAIFWSMLWAMILFHEKITPANTLGILLIFSGIMVVNRDAA